MTTTGRFARTALLAFVLVPLAAGCSDDSGGDATTAPIVTDIATTLGGVAPGTITVSVPGITGQNGKMLLVFATSPTQGGQLGVACVAITSDSFDVPSTALTEVPADNPCAGGTATVAFPEGSYTITAGIYTPGSRTAEAEASMTVDIVGDGVGSVQFSGSALSPG